MLIACRSLSSTIRELPQAVLRPWCNQCRRMTMPIYKLTEQIDWYESGKRIPTPYRRSIYVEWSGPPEHLLYEGSFGLSPNSEVHDQRLRGETFIGPDGKENLDLDGDQEGLCHFWYYEPVDSVPEGEYLTLEDDCW
jgi:hypothetical protein